MNLDKLKKGEVLTFDDPFFDEKMTVEQVKELNFTALQIGGRVEITKNFDTKKFTLKIC